MSCYVYRGSAANYDAAATFEEIGEAIGESPKMAYYIYCRALHKLRKNPERLKQLLVLAEEVSRIRGQREDVYL